MACLASRGSDFHPRRKPTPPLGSACRRWPPADPRVDGAGRPHPPRLRVCLAMAQRFEVHPDNPQPRFLRQAAQSSRPAALARSRRTPATRSSAGWDDKAAAEQLRRVRAGRQAPPDLAVPGPLSELVTLRHVGTTSSTGLLRWRRPGPSPSSCRPPRRCHGGSPTPAAAPSACGSPSTM